MQIREIHNPWRDRWQTAIFRGAMFFVEIGGRAGGRRVALHQYPKRDIPYAEDMGRTANKFTVQGYLIGPNYLTLRDNLITALEKPGPGLLRLPLPYQSSDVNVMVTSYSISESREKGGVCQVDMEFVEYGDPSYRPTQSTTGQIENSATGVENSVASQAQIGPQVPVAHVAAEVSQYVSTFKGVQ
jgi:prophage DNA circulation protein